MERSFISPDCLIHENAILEAGVSIGPRVTLAGEGIVVRANARLDAACVIGERVVIGQGAHVRAGAVVLGSVPPNAIVEGNPAQIVGYRDDLRGSGSSIRQFGAHTFKDLPRPGTIPLDVGKSALFLMRRMTDTRGALTVGEFPSEMPFSPARYFVVFDVPSQELRGEHAHKLCKQFLICVHGSCRVLLDDGIRRCEVTLDRPDMAIFMPEMIWGTQYRYSSDAVMLVFASLPYASEDYIRTYEEFITESQKFRS